MLAAPVYAQTPPSVPAHKPVPRPQPAQIVDQLGMLVFNDNPASEIPTRPALSRWIDQFRLLVFGQQADVRDAVSAVGAVSRASHLSMVVMSTPRPGEQLPNSFLVVNAPLDTIFRTSLRPMLASAFAGNMEAVDNFITTVVAVQPCWVLPVWSDPRQVILKGAVIGVDSRQPRPVIQRCILRQVAAATGLLGPDGFLPRSVFSPEASVLRLSYEDTEMLRLLYSPALKPGMTPDEVSTAALTLLKHPVRKPAPKPAPAP
jgi:hypothetical protein